MSIFIKEKEHTTMSNARAYKARRQLKKMGFILKKSRIRNINMDNFGGFMILDGHIGHIVEGDRFQLDIDDVEDFIKELCV
jgi:hypothetical protein